MRATKTTATLIVLPCYNEREALDRVLRAVHREAPGCDTLVVDDGSLDDSAAIAATLSPCLRLPMNLGIGAAVQAGIKYAARNGYDVCIQVDADGQHPPSQIRMLQDAHRLSRANLVIGSRFLEDSGFKSSATRRAGIRVIHWSLRALFGRRITDPTSGFRLMDRAAIELFSRDYPKDFPEPISTARALRHGFVVQEVPVAMEPRRSGRSSIFGVTALLYMLRVIGMLVLVRLGKRR